MAEQVVMARGGSGSTAGARRAGYRHPVHHPFPARRLGAASVAAILAVAGLVATTVAPASAAPVNECWPSDNGNPVIDSFTLSTDAVDVTETSQQVSIEAEVHDVGGPGPATGVATVLGLTGRDGAKSWTFVSYRLRRDADGTWRGAVTIPKGAPPGEWFVYSVQAVDADKNNQVVVDEHDVTPDLDRYFTVTSVEDAVEPELVSLDLSRTRVDTRRRAQRVAVSVLATDDNSGVASGHVTGRFTRSGASAASHVVSTRLVRRGDRLVGAFRVARWLGNGRLRLDDLVIRDGANNAVIYDETDLDRPHVERDVVVRSRTRPATEHVAPRLVSLRRQPGTLDVRSGPDSITFTVRARDGRFGRAVGHGQRPAGRPQLRAAVLDHPRLRLGGTDAGPRYPRRRSVAGRAAVRPVPRRPGQAVAAGLDG